MVFTLPSLPSGLSSLLDTSPPVFYPAPTAQNQNKRAQSQSTDSPRRDRETSSPIAGPSRLRGREESPLPLPVSVSANDVSGIWQPLPSRNREAARYRQRRQSLAGPASGLHADDVSDTEIEIDPFLLPGTRSKPSGTPTRPAHRRSQSAVPFPVLGSESSTPRSLLEMGKVVRPGSGHEPGPMGRLHEFSRNSLASISAVSLPTLAELESDIVDRDGKDGPNEGFDFPRRYGVGVGVGRSIPPSPLVRPHDRRSSKASPILGPTSPTHTPPSDLAKLGHSPSECESSLGLMVDLTSTMSISSVPPPAQAQYQSMPITHAAAASPTRRHRPPLSPRSWTFQDINQPFATAHNRRASIDSNSSVSLSDVNVLAKWSFPSSPSPGKKPSSELPDVTEAPRGRQPGPSDRLRERLRSLSALDTASLPASSSAPSISGVSATRSSAGQSLASAHINGSDGGGGGGGRAGPIKPSRPLPSYLTSNHRHTHSSPIILQIPGIGCITPPSHNQNQKQQTQSQLQLQPKGSMGPPLFPPPPRPQRRPTTSRLRQPTPLSMPIRPSVGRHISHTSLISLSGVGGAGSGSGLSSSPGSMVSDSSSNLCPSPTSSVKSLPVSISSTDLILSDVESNNYNNSNGNGQQQQQKSGKGKAWWAIPMPALGRSRSRNTTKSDQDDLLHIHTQVKEVTLTTYGSGSENGDSRREEEDDEEEETFIDMDQM